MDRHDRLFRFYCRNPSTGAWDIFKAVLFGFKGKLKWSIFISYYARSHILLTSGTLLLLPQLRLKIGHPLTQITHHPLPTLSTPTSPLSALPPSTLTILHHPLHLFLIAHPPFPCIQQLLNGARMLLLSQTKLCYWAG